VTGCAVSVGARAGELVKGLLTGAELATVGCCAIFGAGVSTLLLGVVIADVVTAGIGAGIAVGVN
jgi:hypothetical protein